MQAGDAARLTRVLGMLGSEHAGERAAAALAADRLIKRLGLSWQEILTPPHDASRDTVRKVTAPSADILGAMQSRLRQSQRENADLRRQITRLNRRLEGLFHHQSPLNSSID